MAQCCGLRAASPCSAGVLRLLAVIFAMVITWLFIREYINFNMKTLRLPRWMGEWGSLLGQEPGPGVKDLVQPWVTQEVARCGTGLPLGPHTFRVGGEETSPPIQCQEG